MKLSIGQAWDEAKGVFRADGRAIIAIALALTVLPGAILETVSPSNTRTTETPWWVGLLGLLVALIGLTSQIAISRIALGSSTTVGGALKLAFQRLPALFGALFLVALPFILLAFVALGGAINPNNVPPAQAAVLLVLSLAGLFVLVRLLLMTPLAADRQDNSIALIRTAWSLSRGHFFKLLGLILLLMLVALLLMGALGGALSAVVLLAFGPIEAGNLSALLLALIQQGLGAAVSVLFVVLVCRLYLQATGGSAGSVSVPHARSE
jgi:hypothetical protein